ncbi:MAG: hypothetical protein HQK51_07505 [Oligoflexia bacterium]|nr:hypothetical protein [Oligoflexia bacterium]
MTDAKVYLTDLLPSNNFYNLLVISNLKKQISILINLQINEKLSENEFSALLNFEIIRANEFKYVLCFYYTTLVFLVVKIYNALFALIIEKIYFKSMKYYMKTIKNYLSLFIRTLYYPLLKIFASIFSCRNKANKHIEQFIILNGKNAAHDLALAITKLSCFNKRDAVRDLEEGLLLITPGNYKKFHSYSLYMSEVELYNNLIRKL